MGLVAQQAFAPFIRELSEAFRMFDKEQLRDLIELTGSIATGFMKLYNAINNLPGIRIIRAIGAGLVNLANEIVKLIPGTGGSRSPTVFRPPGRYGITSFASMESQIQQSLLQHNEEDIRLLQSIDNTLKAMYNQERSIGDQFREDFQNQSAGEFFLRNILILR